MVATRRGQKSKDGGSARERRRGRRGTASDPLVAKQAAGHSKIRRDHSSEVAEDYVELIARLQSAQGEARTVDLAARLGVSHVTVTKTISRLQREGLVQSEPYRSIFLTGHGEELARRAAERHRLVVDFLRKLGVNEADAEADAEGIEHHVSHATLEAMRRFVGNERA